MVSIVLKTDSEIIIIEAEGHATGDPTVCACISFLLQSLNGWAKTEQQGASVIEELGYNRTLSPNTAESRTVFWFAYYAFIKLQHAYPELIEVNAEKL